MFHRGTEASGPGGDDDISWSEKYHAPGSSYYNGNGHSSWEAVSDSQKPLQDTVNTAKPAPFLFLAQVEADHVIKRLEELAPAALLGQQNFFMGWDCLPHIPTVDGDYTAPTCPSSSPRGLLSSTLSDLAWTFPGGLPSLFSIPSNPYVPEDMPSYAWSNWAELRAFSDCANDNPDVGDPHLGEVNVTLPDWKTKDLRWADNQYVFYQEVLLLVHLPCGRGDWKVGKRCPLHHKPISRVLDVLEDLGLAESTIVAFWGDHGWQMGEHSEWCKHTNFEVAAHAPLMLRVPGVTDSGLRSGRLVEFVDIFPTLVEAADFEPLELCPEMSNTSLLCTEGSSLLPLLENPESRYLYPHLHLQKVMPGKVRCSGSTLGAGTLTRT